MTVYDVSLPNEINPCIVESFALENASLLGLLCRLDTELKQYPGSKHWHFARADERGTLEVTFLAKQRRFWISFHSNRTADWLPRTCEELKVAMEKSLLI